MRSSRLDLNLLEMLNALYEERSVTRAAEKLNISQPAVSAGLAKLRKATGDVLFIQSGRQLTPTSYAVTIMTRVRELLIKSDGLLEFSNNFQPNTAERQIRCMFTDYISSVLMVEVTRRISRAAPGITFSIYPPRLHPAQSIERGEVDIVVMPKQYLSTDHPQERLFRDDSVCIAWNGNKNIGDTLSLNEYLRFHHVVASVGGHPERIPSIVDQWLFRKVGTARKVDIITTDFYSIPQYVSGTSRIATVHRLLAKNAAKVFDLKILQCPLKIPTITVCMQWNQYQESDPCLKWVREFIRSTAYELSLPVWVNESS